MAKRNPQNNKDNNLKQIIEKLEKDKQELEQELNKLKEVAAHTQSQYIDLKKDFDMYINRIKSQEEEMKLKYFLEIIKGFIPIIEEIRRSVENIPEDIKSHNWVKGIQMVYDNLIKFLESKGIYIEEHIGEEVNPEKHEPVGLIKTDEEDKKGKIVAHHTKVYVYKKGDKEIVIYPGKVLVGQ